MTTTPPTPPPAAPDPQTAAEHPTWEIHTHDGRHDFHHHPREGGILWHEPSIWPQDQPTGQLIHAAMAQVVREVEAVGKTRQQDADINYAFRGIDKVMSALSPAWGAAGIYCVPRTVTREKVEGARTGGGREGQGGRPWYWWIVEVEYDFVARDGSKVTIGPIAGEGRDLGDQGLKKAYTASYRTLLEKVFCIPFDETAKQEAEAMQASQQADAAGPGVPAGWEGWADHDERVGALRGQASKLPQAGKDAMRERFLEITGGMDPSDQRSWQLPREQVEQLEQALSEIQQGLDAAGGRGPAGPAEELPEEVGQEGVPDPSTEGQCAEVHPEDGEQCTLAAVHAVGGEDHETFRGKRWPVRQGPRPVPFAGAEQATQDAARQAAGGQQRRGRQRAGGAGDPAWQRRRDGGRG